METNDFYKGVIQGIVGERGFPQDPTQAEDDIFWRLGELASGKDPVITDEEALECWTQYIQSVQPDARVIHLGQTVARPFYE